jgi:FMN phosphatase YigB (HAD superfamily)
VELAALLADWSSRHGGQADGDAIERAVEAVGTHWLGAGLSAYPGALEAVQALNGAGYRLGLVSNVFIPPVYCRRELERQGFASMLAFAVFSSEVGYRKPAPAIYEAALSAAFPDGRPADLSRVLFVGDSPSCDVTAPAAMGMKTALVAGEPGTWPASEVAAARPDLRLEAIRELPGRVAE